MAVACRVTTKEARRLGLDADPVFRMYEAREINFTLRSLVLSVDPEETGRQDKEILGSTSFVEARPAGHLKAWIAAGG